MQAKRAILASALLAGLVFGGGVAVDSNLPVYQPGATAVREWLGIGVQTLSIEPASPWENGYIESFNG